MKRSRKLAAAVLSTITCVACTKTEAQPAGAQGEPATVELGWDTTQNCQVHYGSVNRAAQCNEVGSVMLSKLQIPTRVRIVVRPSRTADYEQVGQLLQSLQNSGYLLIEFPSR